VIVLQSRSPWSIRIAASPQDPSQWARLRRAPDGSTTQAKA